MFSTIVCAVIVFTFYCFVKSCKTSKKKDFITIKSKPLNLKPKNLEPKIQMLFTQSNVKNSKNDFAKFNKVFFIFYLLIQK